MPKWKDSHHELRVVLGGKSTNADAPDNPGRSAELEKLTERAEHYRFLLADHPDQEALALVADMVEAIEALRRLELSADREAQERAVEYRRLIAELEIEIVATLQTR